MIRDCHHLRGYSTATLVRGRRIVKRGLRGSRRVSRAILALAALLAACAEPAPPATPAPTSAPAFTSVPAPQPTRRPTTVEVDPTAPPAPSPTPAARGDCPASYAALDAVDHAMFGNLTLIQDTFVDRRFVIWDNQYHLYDIPMLLVRRDRAGAVPAYGFLVNHPDSTNLANAGTFATPTYFDLGTVYCISPLPGTYELETKPYLPGLPFGANRDTPTKPEEVDDFA